MYFVCFPQNFQKSNSKFFFCQNRKSELSIDGLIISVPLLTFGVRKRQKCFVKWVKKPDLSALLKFASLNVHFLFLLVEGFQFKINNSKLLAFQQFFFCYFVEGNKENLQKASSKIGTPTPKYVLHFFQAYKAKRLPS